MKQTLNLLFPTPLVQTNIGVDYVIEKVGFKRPLSDNGWISDDSKYLDRNKKLKNTIENEIETYLREILRLKNTVYLKHQSSWVLVHTKGDYSHKHYHQNSWLSGIYYHQIPPNSGNVTFFASPPSHGWTSSQMSPYTEIEEYNPLNSSLFVVEPKAGDLLLFPSHVEHSSGVNVTDYDRSLVSFNYSLHGTWGDSTSRITI